MKFGWKLFSGECNGSTPVEKFTGPLIPFMKGWYNGTEIVEFDPSAKAGLSFMPFIFL
jgi:hypothetical protein